MYRRSQRWMLIINNRFLSLYDYNFLLVKEKIFSVNQRKVKEKNSNPWSADSRRVFLWISFPCGCFLSFAMFFFLLIAFSFSLMLFLSLFFIFSYFPLLIIMKRKEEYSIANENNNETPFAEVILKTTKKRSRFHG